jgi:hypothetical protein
LLLEDLHWIDSQSLRLLVWIVEHAPELPVLWLMTARMESKLAEVRAAFPEDRAPARTLEPLSRDAATQLFISVAPHSGDDRATEIASRAYSVTGGNPLFVREIAAHWIASGMGAGLPTNIRALMRGRVERLSSAAQRVLHCCAVLGRYASIPRVATVLELSTSELLACVEEVEALGISGVGGEPGSLVLHDLWQEELVGALRPAPRALLHLRCGDVLEREGLSSKQAAVITEAARHFVLAGVRDKAVDALREAAKHHRTNGLDEAAIRVLDQAVELCTDDDTRFNLHVERIDALRSVGGWPEIRRTLQLVLAPEGKRKQLNQSHSNLELTDVEATMLADADLAVTVDRAARCASSAYADDFHRASAARIGARAAANLFMAERLSFFALIAEQLAERTPTTRLSALSVDVVFHTEMGDLSRALASAAEIVEGERTIGSVLGLSRALRHYTVPLRVIGEFDGATAVATEAFDAATTHGLVDESAATADILAWVRFEAGDINGAEAWIAAAEPWLGRVTARFPHTSASTLRAMIAIDRGKWAEATNTLDRTLDQALTKAVLRQRMFFLAIHAQAALLADSLDRARACADQLHAALLEARVFRRNEYFIGALIRVLRRTQSEEAARAVLEEVGQRCVDPGVAHSRYLREAFAA